MFQNRTNFPSRDGAGLTLLLVLLAITGSELVLRTIDDRLSGNVEHVNKIPDLANAYYQSDHTSLLFLGNSLTNNGIDLTQAREMLSEKGMRMSVINKIVPDATAIWAWSCIMENQFLDRGFAPGTVVLGFGWNQLSDQSQILPTPLGAFYCNTADLKTINEQRTLTSAEIGEFFTARLIRTYAHREAIRNRVLSQLIANYESITQANNRRMRRMSESSDDQVLSYSVLANLIDQLENRASRLVVMAMPVRDGDFEIDHALKNLLSSKGVELLDYRNLDEIGYELFLDDMHLNNQGANILTSRLVSDLTKIVAPVRY